MRISHGLILSLTPLFLSATAASLAQSTTMLRVVKSGFVLAEPSPNGTVVGTVFPSEILELLDERDSWLLVRPPGNAEQAEWRTGWVGRAMVEHLDAAVRLRQPASSPSPSRARPAPGRGSTEAPIRLSHVEKIYIAEMPDDLHAYIAAEMTSKFRGRISPVLNPDLADAILTGTGEHQSGTGAAVTGRWLGLHDTASAAVILTDATGTHLLWADEAGDRSLFWGSWTRGGPRKVASRLMKHLDKAIKEDLKNGR